MNIFKRIKKALDASMERMADDNKAEFGSGQMSCCGLNQKENEKHKRKG